MLTDLIDAELGDNLTCTKYEEVSTFYRNLERVAYQRAKESTIKRILKISK